MNLPTSIFLYVAVAGFALLVTLVTTPLVIRLSHTLDVLDKPATRKIHKGLIPRMGGLSIFAGLIAGLGFYCLLEKEGFALLRNKGYFVILAASFIMLLLGLFDDKYGLNAKVKFTVQIIAAAIIIIYGIKIERITNPFGGAFDLGWLAYPISFLWIVGVTNAINLSDGMDGLATGICLIVAMTMFAVSLVTQHPGTLVVSAILSGALIGFLRYNFNPARIFMGDTGSQFLGFLLAALSIKGSLVSSTTVSFLVPLIALGLPIFDTLFAFLRRIVTGANPFSADKMHIHHRLLSFGFNQRQVVIMLYTVSILFGIIAFTLTATSNQIAAGLLLVFAIIIYVGIRRLGYMEAILVRMKKKRYSEKRKAYHATLYGETEPSMTPVIQTLSRKRVFEILIDAVFFTGSLFLTRLLMQDWETIFFEPTQLRDQAIILAACCYLSFFAFGFYREMWRYIDLNAIGKYVKGVTAAALLGYFALSFINPELTLSPKEILVFWVFLLVSISSSRVLFNFYATYQKRELTRLSKGEKVLIYGAGDRGVTVLSALIKEDNLDYRPVGFIDDNPAKRDREILGYRVFGDIAHLDSIVREQEVERIIISSAYINGHREGALKEVCRRHNIKLSHFSLKFDNIPIEG
ncbi:MAG: hypothetical protein A2293_10805 [Elusimicrobia bacterium RIFOXYB2_FULL_49_7]|nr:MAG: hypothetical protein A2293_10805 [Elusimicrobia bacterium RIFOXYB2_FULL_49_7]